jgi:hypothetical protein
MSRKNPADQLADDLGCLIIGLLWVMAVGLFTLIVKAFQTSPEAQLLKLQPGYAWLSPVEAKACPQCGTANANYILHCYRCGSNLDVPKPVSPTQSQATALNQEPSVFVGIMILLLVIIVVAIIATVISLLQSGFSIQFDGTNFHISF